MFAIIVSPLPVKIADVPASERFVQAVRIGLPSLAA
jgi:hypothetical protein